MNSTWSKLELSKSKNITQDNDYSFGYFIPNKLQRVMILIGKKTILKRGLFRSKYAKLIMSLSKGPMDIIFRKCSFRLWNENNLIEYGLLLDPNYNNDDIDFLINGAKKNSNFVDIGSNVGLYSQPLALASPNGRVISIDANPLMKLRLDFNKKSSNISNIKTINLAVSDTSGKGSLIIRKNDIAIVALDESTSGDINFSTLIEILETNNIDEIYGL